ncbi:MAG: L-threonylcarbamoyladenylate synthase [Rikenellaceae bacterium]
MDAKYIEQVVDILKKGGIILYPTDTVWGIGCDATNAEAVAKIYALKQRSESKSMIVIMDSLDRVSLFFNDLPAVAYELMELSDKPLTLILDSPKRIASNLVADDDTLAVRVADHEFCKAVCRKLARPLVSTSANISGEPTPTKFEEINSVIKEGVDLVVDKIYQKGATGKPSSIIKLGKDRSVKIIRQ